MDGEREGADVFPLGRLLMLMCGALAMLVLTPGTTCVLLHGVGVDHHHHDDAVTEGACFDRHCDHGGEEPVPCPEAEGKELDSHFVAAAEVSLARAVWVLVATGAWTDLIGASPAAEILFGNGEVPLPEMGGDQHHRVLFCRFLI